MAEDEDRRSRRKRKVPESRSILEKIRRHRESGEKIEYEDQKVEEIFEYVDEKEYADIIRKRQQDDWIEDDDGRYCEHGREIIDEEIEPSKRKKQKQATHVLQKQPVNIKSMLLSKKRKKPDESLSSSSLESDALLGDILSELKSSHHTTPNIKKTKPSIRSTPGVVVPRRLQVSHDYGHVGSHDRSYVGSHDRSHVGSYSTPVAQYKDNTVAMAAKPYKYTEVKESVKSYSGSAAMDTADTTDTGAGSNDVHYDDICVSSMDLFDDDPVDFSISDNAETQKGSNELVQESSSSTVPTTTNPPVDQSIIINEEEGWETVRGEPEQVATVHVDSSSLPVREVDGEQIMSFYWIDAYEEPNLPGTVFLFGKVGVADDTFVSCCVIVKNVQRCLYVLPRKKILSSLHGNPTDNDVTMQDVYKEFNDMFAGPFRIMKFSSRVVEKKYAFEKTEVPDCSQYLEVKYSAEYRAPPHTASGKTFSHVFGTTTSSLEQLILTAKLRGPGWLCIKNPSCPAQPKSWCRVECVIDNPSHLSVAADQPAPPPLVVMSIAIKTVVNPRTHVDEVVAAGSLVQQHFTLDKPAKPALGGAFSVICRPNNQTLPYDFSHVVKATKLSCEITQNERALLAFLLAKINKLDPDIIVGHGISSLALSVLIHRMEACKVPQWSRLGRLRRTKVPNSHAGAHVICCGRLVCDIRLSCQELIRMRSYDLTELTQQLLKKSHQQVDKHDILAMFSSSDKLKSLLDHTMNEAFYSLSIMYELNVLPLAYRITTIAGKTLARTLLGGRSERNEFLLLHAFISKGYVCPDKLPNKRPPPTTEEGDAADEGSHVSKRKKPAYSGGLVLEPKKGFYDNYILLLDFNSLYPSIIQEYNICFTTVDRFAVTDDELPNILVGSDKEVGILPTEIRVLVERRRNVKQQMKDPKLSHEEYLQYDITQKALKLTANSLYGCLGFTHSRFYAKHLAALVTSKGREILQNTKELVEKLNLEVIYGDTDSIMINTKTRDTKQAYTIGKEVKEKVNKCYKLLEIDIDGLFRTMLLLKKKKYAALVEQPDGSTMKEVKGLDVVRRDWSTLARETGQWVLDQVLTPGSTSDQLVQCIHDHLIQLKERVKAGENNLEDFVITKSLTKHPNDYPDKKNLPHVQVAMRMMSNDIRVQAGDVVPYIICKDGTSNSPIQRAYHIDEVRKAISSSPDGHLLPDTEYYLHHQVHSVVSRLCSTIQGTSPAQLAECLGLNPAPFQRSEANEEMEDDPQVVGQSQKEERLKFADPFSITCPHCGQVSEEISGDQLASIRCIICQHTFTNVEMANQLQVLVRHHIDRYHKAWLMCEDQSCGLKTRCVPLDSRMTCPQCHQNSLKAEYPASSLYYQLLKYQEVFSAKSKQSTPFDCKRLIDGYIESNDFSQVNLQLLFRPLIDTFTKHSYN